MVIPGYLSKFNTAVHRFLNYAENESISIAAKRIQYDIHEYFVEETFNRYGEDYGTSIWERDWDVLIILDACRTDVMDDVADDYEFLEKHTKHNSLGSNSGQWLTRNFNREYAEEMSETALISGNPHTDQIENENDFAAFDEVWRYAWDSDDDLFEPAYVTDRSISISRNSSYNKLIVHYMQPHLPSIPHLEGSSDHGNRTTGVSEWRDISAGLRSKQEMWDEYRDNLLYVLEDVELLLNSIDADKVVISADHGEAVGEWGIYGHPYIPMRVLREVPWVVTTATDSGEYQPSSDFDRTQSPNNYADRDDQLEALGYKT